MATDRSLRKQLENLVRNLQEFHGEWLEEDFTWPPRLLDLVRSESFAGFEWSALHMGARTRILGIRALTDSPFFSLAQLAAAGYQVDSRRQTAALPRAPILFRYIVVEFVSETEIATRVVVHLEPGHWRVIDEHILRQRQHCTQ